MTFLFRVILSGALVVLSGHSETVITVAVRADNGPNFRLTIFDPEHVVLHRPDSSRVSGDTIFAITPTSLELRKQRGDVLLMTPSRSVMMYVLVQATPGPTIDATGSKFLVSQTAKTIGIHGVP